MSLEGLLTENDDGSLTFFDLDSTTGGASILRYDVVDRCDVTLSRAGPTKIIYVYENIC